MGIPSADEQVRFLRDVQALLEDGQFVATYKYALLIALADLTVESGVADDGPLEVPVRSIAEKFIEYYWQQSAPFMGGDAARVLQQNTGRQAAVISDLTRLRAEGVGSLSQLRSNSRVWRQTVSKVARIVRVMPLFKLQYVGGTLRPFLYPHLLQNDAITLGSGVAYCLRQFHTLITGLVGQRLIRRLCDRCKIPFHEAHADGILDFDLAEKVARVAGERVGGVFACLDGACPHCGGGFAVGGRGRAAPPACWPNGTAARAMRAASSSPSASCRTTPSWPTSGGRRRRRRCGTGSPISTA